MSKLLVPSLTALVLLSATPASGRAQTYAEVVWNQLNRAFSQVRDQGYSTRNYIIGRLNHGADDTWTFVLPSGSFKVVGVCDEDCSDLDLRVYQGDKLLVEDLLTDDVPIVDFKLSGETRVTLRVSMANCKSNPCFWGIGLFYR